MSDTLVPSTAAIADACVRLEFEVRLGPPGLRPIAAHAPIAGAALPVTHVGSVDAFLAAIDDAEPGDVLVVDNGGRHDEACVGDLVTLEAKAAGVAGIVIWGRHRDTAQIIDIGLPVHSLGARSVGPRRVPPPGRSMTVAWLDGVEVTNDDIVAADDDGVIIVRAAEWQRVSATALQIQQVEVAQADRMRAGESLRSQLDFSAYRALQAAEPDLSLRRYLAERGGAIEV